MAYCTAAQVKTYLSITGTGDDSLIGELIARTQAAIDAYCGGRTFEASQDTTRYFTVGQDTDGRELYFDQDCASITTVKNNLDNGSNGVTVSSSQYNTLPRNAGPYYGIRLLSSASIAWEYTNDPESAVSVTGRWAYSTSAPADIVQACIRWVAYLYRQKDAVVEVTASPETGGYTVPAGIPSDVRDLLSPYIKRV